MPQRRPVLQRRNADPDPAPPKRRRQRTPKPLPPPVLVARSWSAAVLGCSTENIRRYEKAGLLDVVRPGGPNSHPKNIAEQVMRLARGEAR